MTLFVFLPRLLVLPLLMSLSMLLVCWLSDEAHLYWGFLMLCGACISMQLVLLAVNGLLPYRIARDDGSVGSHLALAAVAWLIVPVLCTIPFYYAGIADDNAIVFAMPVIALFEAFSGLTSTGLTMSNDPSQLPLSIQFWRSSLQWVGGIGIAVFMLVLANPKIDGGDLQQTEISISKSGSTQSRSRWIIALFTGLTCVACLTLWAAGMPPWEALNHGMTAVATGGFSVTSDSMQSYSADIQALVALFFCLGAMSFGFYYLIARGEMRRAFQEHQGVVCWFFLALTACLILYWSQSRFESDPGWSAALFNGLSAIATAGYANETLDEWHSAPLMILVVSMIVGGTSGSTAGGVKSDRVLLAARGILWRIQRLFRQNNTEQHRFVDGESFNERDARLRIESASTMLLLWLLCFIIGCLLLAPTVGDQWNFTQIAFEVASAQSGTGLSAGITSPTLPDSALVVLIVLMWAGRLELIAVIALIFQVAGRARTDD